ncbi:NAD(P)-dependent alcohol dehydrogenase [Lentzea aerocolonigenes]|uniref:NAD(P)-dependent alcohol dehydrogenase n=1 Tax=Lentzea aerocolonigenes TaxID=68170 RepID=UPI0004C2FB69|nr:NAD(P)-dependent alcohol dehydrogenase [Lentzea aerocolonigenes]MCP2242233.1 alcohol dehydrogenase, propanol-preferring [Lentzea aerocolonigenes]
MTPTRKTPAVRLSTWGGHPELTEAEVPDPIGDEVLVRVEAAGVCHSDLHVLDARPGTLPYRLPFTLGHEIAGRVAAIGTEARGVTIGERVVVHGPWGCGQCRRCVAGQDNYCDRRAGLEWSGAGLGRDGGMAGHVLVPHARHLVPAGELDATQAAPLTDAGLTPYHAIAGLVDELGEDSAVAVVGVGGLGHLAVQLLRALTPSRVVAVDTREDALELAHSCGAHLGTLARADTADVLRAATGGTGFDAVLDFVGNDATLALGAATLRTGGTLVALGSGGGRLMIGKPGPLPQGATLSLPFWGTGPELHAVVALALAGKLRVATDVRPLTEAVQAFDDLRAGRVLGRVVLVPS